MTLSLKQLARAIGITTGAVMKAVNDGRITSFIKSKQGYQFDADRALEEYYDNTNGAMRRPTEDEGSDDSEDDYDGSDIEKNAKKSPLKLKPEKWTVAQAVQAKNIFQALKAKHELEVQQGKYYPKTDADKFWSSVVNAMARNMISLPSKLKQKHSELPEAVFDDLKILCDSIMKDVKKSME